MTFADVIIKLWDKGGVPLLLLVGLYLIAKFIASRFVKALDGVGADTKASITKIADAVTVSSQAQVSALAGLTERVSRMEGKVDTLGQLAVREAQSLPPQLAPPQLAPLHPRAVAVASVVEVFDDDGNTPIGVPIPEPQSHPMIPSLPPRKTPPKGTAYAVHARPGTKGGAR